MPLNKHPISGQEAVADVRNGMSDRDLMMKYHLSATGLLIFVQQARPSGHADRSRIGRSARARYSRDRC